VGVSDGVADGPTEASTDGDDEGAGDGIIVGEHTGGSPFGCTPNIGWSGRHSYAQHFGQPSGNGVALQSGLPICDPVQSPGRSGSLYGRKQSAKGQPSRISEHSEGIMLGLLLGFDVSIRMTASTVGSVDGTGDGNGVGLQSIRSWGSRHSSGQQLHATPTGMGMFRHIVLPIDAQLTGLSFGSDSQHAGGHWSIR